MADSVNSSNVTSTVDTSSTEWSPDPASSSIVPFVTFWSRSCVCSKVVKFSVVLSSSKSILYLVVIVVVTWVVGKAGSWVVNRSMSLSVVINRSFGGSDLWFLLKLPCYYIRSCCQIFIYITFSCLLWLYCDRCFCCTRKPCRKLYLFSRSVKVRPYGHWRSCSW